MNTVIYLLHALSGDLVRDVVRYMPAEFPVNEPIIITLELMRREVN